MLRDIGTWPEHRTTTLECLNLLSRADKQTVVVLLKLNLLSNLLLSTL